MTQLRHRKLVQLLGYCQVRGELVLVYDYMTNGSQDEHLYGGDRPAAGLSWERCGRILQDVLAELFCLHEGWEQVLVHELGRLWSLPARGGVRPEARGVPRIGRRHARGVLDLLNDLYNLFTGYFL